MIIQFLCCGAFIVRLMHRLCLQLTWMKQATRNSHATGSAFIKQSNYADYLSSTGDDATRYECHFINYESDKSLNTENLRAVFEAEDIITPGI